MRLLLPLLLCVAGCTSLPPLPSPEAAEQHCLVCRHRRDFDCLVADKSPSTPHADYAGRTHYFCGPNCRAEFKRTPARFWPLKK